jgi:short-subunit dehydrogenase
MHGAAAALPYFLRRRRGILITNISIGGFVPVPFAAAYTASKFGLRGFMASLRQELRHEPGIHVCSVFPATVDTPGYQHGANVSGRRLEISPGLVVLSPEQVAHAMVSLALHPRDELPLGWPTRLAKTAYALAPLTTERATGRFLRAYVRRGEPEPMTNGNLFTPVAAGTGTNGGWRKPPRSRRIGTAIASGLLAASAALATVTALRHPSS